MPVVTNKSVLTGIIVKEAMRRNVVSLPLTTSLNTSINYLIKNKINALLVTDEFQRPAGAVSKTDIMGAYYADLPLDTWVGDIMVSPLIYCYPDDGLETALDSMLKNGIHRLFVRGSNSEAIVGILAYNDVVGILYRYCHACDRSIAKARQTSPDQIKRLTVKEVMTPRISAFQESDLLVGIIERLYELQFGAVLVKDEQKKPVGVVSKTDLILAYKHGHPVTSTAESIMNAPVESCDEKSLLNDAIRQMLLKDIQRLFVHANTKDDISGVLSLTDAAQIRSGSCRACTSSRLMTA
ncbi:MAG: CBS domain-containing protein [Desulfobacterales bacterium]|nr:CBS domain-containing protein [Desulfobacterales bacterium]MDJ0914059.1 CBS domain-containing protein [Desulfobacterales bacterium]